LRILLVSLIKQYWQSHYINMKLMGHPTVWMIIVLVVIILSLSMIFPTLMSLPLAMAIFIGISCYIIKLTMLGSDMDKENICNEMLLRSRINYEHISCDHKFKSKDCPDGRPKIRREKF
jgi:hypothetical protein